jgi:hypothetical protein
MHEAWWDLKSQDEIQYVGKFRCCQLNFRRVQLIIILSDPVIVQNVWNCTASGCIFGSAGGRISAQAPLIPTWLS